MNGLKGFAGTAPLGLCEQSVYQKAGALPGCGSWRTLLRYHARRVVRAIVMRLRGIRETGAGRTTGS